MFSVPSASKIFFLNESLKGPERYERLDLEYVVHQLDKANKEKDLALLDKASKKADFLKRFSSLNTPTQEEVKLCLAA